MRLPGFLSSAKTLTMSGVGFQSGPRIPRAGRYLMDVMRSQRLFLTDPAPVVRELLRSGAPGWPTLAVGADKHGKYFWRELEVKRGAAEPLESLYVANHYNDHTDYENWAVFRLYAAIVGREEGGN